MYSLLCLELVTRRVGIPVPAALHIFACPGLQGPLSTWGSVDFTKEADCLPPDLISRSHEGNRRATRTIISKGQSCVSGERSLVSRDGNR